MLLITEHKKLTEKLEKCYHCPSQVEKYLVVDEGKQVSLPNLISIKDVIINLLYIRLITENHIYLIFC